MQRKAESEGQGFTARRLLPPVQAGTNTWKRSVLFIPLLILACLGLLFFSGGLWLSRPSPYVKHWHLQASLYTDLQASFSTQEVLTVLQLYNTCTVDAVEYVSGALENAHLSACGVDFCASMEAPEAHAQTTDLLKALERLVSDPKVLLEVASNSNDGQGFQHKHVQSGMTEVEDIGAGAGSSLSQATGTDSGPGDGLTMPGAASAGGTNTASAPVAHRRLRQTLLGSVTHHQQQQQQQQQAQGEALIWEGSQERRRLPQSAPDSLLSFQVLDLSCSGYKRAGNFSGWLGGQGTARVRVRSYIEPLFGLMRHPLAWDCQVEKQCTRMANGTFTEADSKASARLFDVSHLLLGTYGMASLPRSGWEWERRGPVGPVGVAGRLLRSVTTQAARRLGLSPAPPVAPPPRCFLFDLGATAFNDLSQTFLTNTYKKRGIVFDRHFMWESQQQDSELWKQVPDEVYHSYQYFNEPVTDDPRSARNPLNILRKLASPSDFVAFKLDIDNSLMERNFISLILKDPELSLRIDEFYWEPHFNETRMVECFWKGSADMSMSRCDIMQLFLALRKRGIRAHGWP